MTNEKKIKNEIKRLRDQLKALREEPKMIRTGKFTLTVADRHGNPIHTLEGFDSRRDAQLQSNYLYKILIQKLKQKVSLLIKPEMKRQA